MPRKRRTRERTAPNQTRGLTDRQREINRATGVNNNYNYNRRRAEDSVFNQLPVGYNRMGAASRRRVARNINRRKSNGGSGG